MDIVYSTAGAKNNKMFNICCRLNVDSKDMEKLKASAVDSKKKALAFKSQSTLNLDDYN